MKSVDGGRIGALVDLNMVDSQSIGEGAQLCPAAKRCEEARDADCGVGKVYEWKSADDNNDAVLQRVDLS